MDTTDPQRGGEPQTNDPTTEPSKGNGDRKAPATASLHRAASIAFLENTAALVVCVKRGEKGAARSWRPAENSLKLTAALLQHLKISDDNFAIHLHGELVDVDVDTDDPSFMAALDALLPPCTHVWGHNERKRTHRLYRLRKPYDPHADEAKFLNRIEKIEEAKVEVRGGELKSGQYTLLPGSIHPDGSTYEWADPRGAGSRTPTVTDIKPILEAIRFAGAIAVLAPHWHEGLRNDLIMALSGFLHRAHKMTEDLSPAFQIDKSSCTRFVETLLDILEPDNTGDRRSRMKTFEATWSKAENEAPVTGGATLAELTGDPEILGRLYLLFCDPTNLSTLGQMLEDFAIWEGPGTVIDLPAARKGSDKIQMTRQQFCNSFGDRFITVPGKKGKRQRIADLMFSLSATQKVRGLTFVPGAGQFVEEREGKKVNQWSGFEVGPWPEPVSEAEVEPFLTYLRDVVCGGDEERYRWVLGWVAHVFQEPANRSKTALVLVGKPGVGKSFLGEHFIRPVIGRRHSAVTNSVERAVGGFNANFRSKIFIQCDEAISSHHRQIAAKLKSLITDPTITIEPKGFDSYPEPNHMRYYFTSNALRDAVFLNDGVEERRYTILEVPDVRRGHIEEYWKPLVDWAKDNLAQVHRFLLDHEYDRALIELPLFTEAKVTMQDHSMDLFDRWLAAMVAQGYPLCEEAHRAWYDALPFEPEPGQVVQEREIDRGGWPVLANYTALARDYGMFARHHNKPYEMRLNERQIRQELKRRGLLDGKERGHQLSVREYDTREQKHKRLRPVLYRFPGQDAIEGYMERKYGKKYTPDTNGGIIETETSGTPESEY